MYLRDLAVDASDDAHLPDNLELQFNLSTHTPVEAYLAALPRRKVILDDLAKVNVAVGPRGGSQPYWDCLNVAIICWPRFDFSRYFKLPRANQQLRILEVLHKALLNIARRTRSDRSWYDAAYEAVRRQQFPRPKIEEEELLRRWGLLPKKAAAAEGAIERPRYEIMTSGEFRKLALSFDGAVEQSHMDHPDFRVGGKIFATLGPGEVWGMVRLKPEDQATFMAAQPEVFAPASGAWGRQGATIIQLKAAKRSLIKEALELAFQHRLPPPPTRKKQ